jgi:hypothetical protein
MASLKASLPLTTLVSTGFCKGMLIRGGASGNSRKANTHNSAVIVGVDDSRNFWLLRHCLRWG